MRTIDLQKKKSIVAMGSHNNIETKQIQLSTGIIAEIMSSVPTQTNLKKPTLVFVHGSFHSSWCWAEHYFDYFASRNYSCFALSLRGTGGTFAGDGVSRVNIDDHVDDLASFLDYVVAKSKHCPNPVVIAHSFGGLVLMKYMERSLFQDPPSLNFSGVAFLCSVPPSGNGKMTLRFLKRSLINSYKITIGLAAKKCITDDKLCRTLFFNGNDDDDFGVSNEDLKRYQGYFQRDTVATIDLKDLANKLPSKYTNAEGKATFGASDCSLFSLLPPSLVVGAQHDFIVDTVGVEETAKYLGISLKPDDDRGMDKKSRLVMVDSSHDVMLGRNWENGAIAIDSWLDDIVI